MKGIKVFTGSSHPELTSLIIDRLGVKSSPASVKRFPNGEMRVELGVSVRDSDVFIIQSGSHTVNDHLMELLVMISSAKSSSAGRITAVLPYFPYNKQSKKKKGRGTIEAKLVAQMLTLAGVDHIITLELHSSMMQGFFAQPCDNLIARPIMAKYISDNFAKDQCIVVAKNAGGTRKVTQLADRLKIDFAIINRERCHVRAENEVKTNQIETKISLVGDVKDKICLILDDMIDNPLTFIDSADHLKKCGAASIHLIAVHGILSNNCLAAIEREANIDSIIITNAYPLPVTANIDSIIITNAYPLPVTANISTKLRIMDISGLLAEAIRRMHNGESMSYLFHTST